MQRFGTRSVPTSAAGLTMLAEKWEDTINLILDLRPEDSGDYKLAREHWKEHGDPKVALDLYPRAAVAERAILNSYVKQGTTRNHLVALNTVPRNMRSMYVHAYQSLVFNNMTTERMKMYGTQVVVGDLVLLKDTDEVKGENVDVAIQNRRETKQNVKVVTEEMVKKFTIFDVVLPLPGFSVSYPTNAIGEKYKQFMATHGMDPHKMEREHRYINFNTVISIFLGLIATFLPYLKTWILISLITLAMRICFFQTWI